VNKHGIHGILNNHNTHNNTYASIALWSRNTMLKSTFLH